MPDWFIEFPSKINLNIKDPIDNFIDYLVREWDPFFDAITRFLRGLLNNIGFIVDRIPWWLLIVLVFVLTWRMSKNIGKAILYSALLFSIGALGLWSLMNTTLTIIIASVIISILIGFPVGVLVSSSDKLNSFVRPILDTMQTMPTFVYLIPAAMLLGLGNVPAVIATTVYAVPPLIRLTSHGIRQVDREVIEAAIAFGSTKWQSLIKVKIPQAIPTIMTGINQTIMMAISMVVTCSMIGVTGLGQEVLISINRLEAGRGFSAGISIVIIAIIIDRLTQGLVEKGEAAIEE
ncbi:MAG: ABC transporter permease subunit [Clostridiaceae bacterium]|jgi:glycine betaine/proline transport system permease protein/glycine betaine/proline transport system substrate-binding protein|nr:ABC transporter permease subunit [Clostridiaceae bacterium]